MKSNHIRCFFQLLACMAACACSLQTASAQAVIRIDSAYQSGLVTPAFLRDPGHALGLEQVQAMPPEAFTPGSGPFLTFGNDPSNWWLRWKVDNTLPYPVPLVLRLNRKNVDALQLYLRFPDGRIEPAGEVGALYHNDERFFLTDGFHLQLTLPGGETELLAKAGNRLGSMHLSMSIETPDAFARHNRRSVLLFGIFLGVMAVSLFLCVVFYMQYRDPVYVLYMAYVVNLLLRETYSYSADFGIFPLFQRHAVSMLIATTFGLFYRRFMQLGSLNRWIDKAVQYYALLIVGVSAAVLVLAEREAGAVLQHVFTLVDATNLFFTLLALVVSLWYFNTSVRARIVTAAYLPLAAGFVAIILRNMNLVPNYPVISQAVMIGFILEVLVFTLGFAIWSRHIEAERNNLQLRLELEQKERQLAVQAAEQRVKDSIARDLHDDVAASMSGIRILSQVAQGQFAQKAPDAAPLLDQINRSAQATLETLGDIIWAVKPSDDFLNDMADRMREYASKVLEARNISYDMNIPRNLPVLDIALEARRNIYLIFKEAVNNALKYSECTHMDIGIRIDGSLLWLHILDNGKGFSRANINNGNGLNNMTQRAQDIGGDLQIVSAPGSGTQVRLYLPLERRHTD